MEKQTVRVKIGGGAQTGGITVRELDQVPTGTNIRVMTFNQDEHPLNVYIDGDEAVIGAPDNAPDFNGTDLSLSNASQFLGRLSQSNINYEGGVPAGSSVTYIQNDTMFNLSSQADSGYGDKGILKLYINGILTAAIDLETNFVEGNRSTQQDLNDYDTDYTEGITYVLVDGVCNFLGLYAGAGSLELLKVERYNNFNPWQTWQIKVNVTAQLRQGYSEIYLQHINTPDGNKTSNTFKFFYDADAGPDPSCAGISTVQNIPVLKWLSGIKYFGSGSTFDIDVLVNDGFDNVYHNSNAPVRFHNWPGLNVYLVYSHGSVAGVSTPPDIGELMTVTNYTFTQAADYWDMDARVQATPRDPYGNYAGLLMASQDYMVNSFGNPSTDKIEYFRDEDYRLLDNAWDIVPVGKTGNWSSIQSLITYDGGNKHGQCYDSKLIYPIIDFTGKKPVGNPDYSPFVGVAPPGFSSFGGNVAKYFRGFYDTNISHTNGIFTLTNITEANMNNKDIEVYIKAPTKTYWLSLNDDYSAGNFNNADGSGCRINKDTVTAPTFQFTLGTNATVAASLWGIVVMILIDGASPELGMTEIDW